MNSSKKRRRHDWKKELPGFLDASATVAATKFAARRLPEIEHLWRNVKDNVIQRPATIDGPLQSNGGKTSSRHLRRRGKSFRSRKRHRFPQGNPQPSDVLEGGKKGRAGAAQDETRRARRKPSRLIAMHSNWCSKEAQFKAVKWLPTHLWHAKRFHLKQMFGWKIPVQNSNRGVRAVHRLTREGRSLVQDVTWRMQPIVFAINSTDRHWIAAMKRIIPAFELTDDLMQGKCMGTAIIYEPDCFPGGVVGPVMWWIGTEPITSLRSEAVVFHLFCHPTVLPQVHDCLKVVAEGSQVPSFRIGELETGVGCIQVTGATAAATLDTICYKTIPLDQLEHLQTVSVALDNRQSGSVTTVDRRSALLVRLKPCDLQYPQNTALVGFWLLCKPRNMANIFKSCVLLPDCVAVGLNEEYHLRMECEPPLPAYPEDFPDAGSGHNGISAEGSVDGESALQPKLSEWLELVHETKEDGGQEKAQAEVTVVRGAFGLPFLQAINSGTISDIDDSRSDGRSRKRRKATNKLFRVTPGLSLPEQRLYVEGCTSLQRSLTMPAILRCQLIVKGNGVFRVGDHVFGKSASPVLGFVTFGYFSLARGAFHGVCFIAARRFLAFLGDGASFLHASQEFRAPRNGWVLVSVGSRDRGEFCECALKLLLN